MQYFTLINGPWTRSRPHSFRAKCPSVHTLVLSLHDHSHRGHGVVLSHFLQRAHHKVDAQSYESDSMRVMIVTPLDCA